MSYSVEQLISQQEEQQTRVLTGIPPGFSSDEEFNKWYQSATEHLEKLRVFLSLACDHDNKIANLELREEAKTVLFIEFLNHILAKRFQTGLIGITIEEFFSGQAPTRHLQAEFDFLCERNKLAGVEAKAFETRVNQLAIKNQFRVYDDIANLLHLLLWHIALRGVRDVSTVLMSDDLWELTKKIFQRSRHDRNGDSWTRRFSEGIMQPLCADMISFYGGLVSKTCSGSPGISCLYLCKQLLKRVEKNPKVEDIAMTPELQNDMAIMTRNIARYLEHKRQKWLEREKEINQQQSVSTSRSPTVPDQADDMMHRLHHLGSLNHQGPLGQEQNAVAHPYIPIVAAREVMLPYSQHHTAQYQHAPMPPFPAPN